jgi:hypothetical protein
MWMRNQRQWSGSSQAVELRQHPLPNPDKGASIMNDRISFQPYKAGAVDFLQLVVAGKIDEAYEIYVDMNGKHHNVYYAADFGALKQGMIENHFQFPNKQLKV